MMRIDENKKLLSVGLSTQQNNLSLVRQMSSYSACVSPKNVLLK